MPSFLWETKCGRGAASLARPAGGRPPLGLRGPTGDLLGRSDAPEGSQGPALVPPINALAPCSVERRYRGGESGRRQAEERRGPRPERAAADLAGRFPARPAGPHHFRVGLVYIRRRPGAAGPGQGWERDPKAPPAPAAEGRLERPT